MVVLDDEAGQNVRPPRVLRGLDNLPEAGFHVGLLITVLEVGHKVHILVESHQVDQRCYIHGGLRAVKPGRHKLIVGHRLPGVFHAGFLAPVGPVVLQHQHAVGGEAQVPLENPVALLVVQLKGLQGIDVGVAVRTSSPRVRHQIVLLKPPGGQGDVTGKHHGYTQKHPFYIPQLFPEARGNLDGAENDHGGQEQDAAKKQPQLLAPDRRSTQKALPAPNRAEQPGEGQRKHNGQGRNDGKDGKRDVVYFSFHTAFNPLLGCGACVHNE